MKRGDATDHSQHPVAHESHEIDVGRMLLAEASGTGTGDANSRAWEIPSIYPQGTVASFEELRISIQKIARHEYNSRMERNPKLSPEEWKMGVYLEELEPQVRGAVLALNRKGYMTEVSGLYKDNIHLIYINSNIDKITRLNLEAIGVKIEEGIFDDKSFTEISFKGTEPNLYTIQDQWREIVAIFPRKGEMATNQSATAKLTRSLDGQFQRMESPELV
jgi:hypothetical protein